MCECECDSCVESIDCDQSVSEKFSDGQSVVISQTVSRRVSYVQSNIHSHLWSDCDQSVSKSW